MISTLGYPSPHSSLISNTRFTVGQTQSSLFIPSRRPSVPLSPGLLPSPPYFVPASLRDSHSIAPAPRGISAVHRLPVEILCNIFSHCDSQSSNKICGPKVTISHVCRRWRSIILCMPLLWTYIYARNPVSTTIDRISTYLRRSGSCPLSISVISDGDLSLSLPPEMDAVWQVIRSYSKRLKSLHLELRGSIQSLIQHIVGCPFPALDDLDLRLRASPAAMTDTLISLLHHTSHISSFAWRGSTPPTSVTWRQLTVLKLSGVYSPGTIFGILHQCRELRVVSVDAISGSDPSPTNCEISLPKLLSITFHTLVNLTSIFRHLHVPALRKMNLRYRMSPGFPRDWKAIGESLLHSSCKLESLVVSDASAGESDLVQCLRLSSLAHLRELHLRDAPITDTVAQALLLNSDGNPAFPALEILRLTNCQSSDGLVGNGLLCSVQGGLKPLQCLEVGLSGVHDQDIKYLTQLRRENIYVEFYDNE